MGSLPPPLPVPVLTPDAAARWDAATAEVGLPPVALMESAGRAVTAIMTQRLGEPLGRGVLVAAGTGHNGGDGWVVARALHRLGVSVRVASLPGDRAPLCGTMRDLALRDGVQEVAPDGPWPGAGVAVDAILGTGARKPLRPEAARLAQRVADLHVPIVAIDGPTGLDLLDGVSYGPLQADLTVTFGGYRQGHLLARDEVGTVVVVDIGFVPPDPVWPVLFTEPMAVERMPTFPANAHKGTRGRVVVVGGDAGHTGAARLAARAAFAAGAGLVHLLVPPESAAILAQAEPDLQVVAQSFGDPLQERALTFLAAADGVVLGPGLGRAPGRWAFVETVLRHAKRAVIDADALVAAQGQTAALAQMADASVLVLTPHAGEFRTLFPELASSLGVDPWTAATAAARQVRATVLLKGVPTVIAGGVDAASSPSSLTVAAGNPGLATGGSGDILSGLIGAFLGQEMAAVPAAALGAQLLGDAADLAALRIGTVAMRPMDVLAAIGDVWRRWDRRRRDPPAPHAPILHELFPPAKG